MAGENNKVVIVTGGSSGIGRCTASALKENGCIVYEFSRRNIPMEGVTHLSVDGGNGLQLWNHALCPAAQRPGGLDRHADGLCDLRRRGRRGGCDRHGASARYPQGAGPLSR